MFRSAAGFAGQHGRRSAAPQFHKYRSSVALGLESHVERRIRIGEEEAIY